MIRRGWFLLTLIVLLAVIGLTLLTDRVGSRSEEADSGQGIENSSSTPSAAPETGMDPGGAAMTNIMDHGATGDGLTPDNIAWDAAVAATAPGGTLLLPPGRAFALPLPVTITKPLRVSGNGATVIKPHASGRVATWFAVAADEVVLDGITFSDPNARVNHALVAARSGFGGTQVIGSTFSGRKAVAVRLVDSEDAVIENNVIDGVREGITVTGASSRVAIGENVVKHWQNYGIRLLATPAGGPSGIQITGNRITDLAPGGHPRYPVHSERGEPNKRLRDVSIVGNVILGPSKSFTANQGGTADQISLHQVDGLLIEGNVSRNSGDMGITVENCTDATIKGNTVTGSDVAGIAIFTNVVDAKVMDNTVLDNGQNRASNRSPASRAGIRLASSSKIGPRNVQVFDNVTGDTQASKTQQYGVSVRDSTDVTIGPNVDAGNKIGLYLDDTANVGLSLVDDRAPA